MTHCVDFFLMINVGSVHVLICPLLEARYYVHECMVAFPSAIYNNI